MGTSRAWFVSNFLPQRSSLTAIARPERRILRSQVMNKTPTLNEAATNAASSVTDTIHRPFFLAGIVTVLTLGCVWGAINLLTIGLRENFSAVKYSWVLAHGHAMVFGFVGFFVMGFAYQAVPRFRQSQLWRPRFAFSSLFLMSAGIILQTVAHLLSPPSFTLE